MFVPKLDNSALIKKDQWLNLLYFKCCSSIKRYIDWDSDPDGLIHFYTSSFM